MHDLNTTAVRSGDALLSLIGNTPLVPLRFEPEGLTIYAKAEFLNPSGSIKDRLAQCIIADAEKRGLLQSDSIILECTSGNTGISLAMVGAAKGYKVAILMSETASMERRHLLLSVWSRSHSIRDLQRLSDRHRPIPPDGCRRLPLFPSPPV